MRVSFKSFNILIDLFLTLPFDYIRNTSVLVSLFRSLTEMDMRKILTLGKIPSSFFIDINEYDEKSQINLFANFYSIYREPGCIQS